MARLNTADGYGTIPKALHWLVFALFAFQYAAAAMMTIGPDRTVAGIGEAAAYNWHKSIGLVALAVAIVRLWARKAGELPAWAPTLSDREKCLIPRAESLLYLGMLAMPVSGFVYVMAGGYGVRLFGVTDLPNPIGEHAWLAAIAKWIHVGGAFGILAALAVHLGIVARHQLWLKDGLLRRMLPTRPPPP